MMSRTLLGSCVLLLAGSMPALVDAQVRASERGTVSQVVDGTTITIDYARPLMRGRVPFPAVVKWNEVWTPGANWATTLAVSRDIELNGHPVAKGKYSIWMIPRESNEWTVLLDGNTRRFHTQKPDPAKAVLSFTVKPQQGPPVEALTWSFPGIARDGATLHMHWGTIYVPLQIAVTPTRPVIARVSLAQYAGRYTVKFDEGPPSDIPVEIVVQDTILRGKFGMTPPGFDPEFDLVPKGNHRFVGQYYQAGKVFEVDEETEIVFTIVNGRATGFEMIFDGKIWSRGTRVK